MIVKMIQNLEHKMESQINSLETRIEKMQERFNKDLEKIKKSQYIMNIGFLDSSSVKESACNAGDPGSIPGLGRSPGEGKGYPLQYSSLENSMDCIVHGVAKSRTHGPIFTRIMQ